MGKNEYGESGHLSIITLLNDAFEVQFFSGLHFYTLPKTLIACRAMQLRFFKVITLLNNAFKKKAQIARESIKNPESFQSP